MKKINKIWAVAIVGVLFCLATQSCASSKNKYGCPERIQALVHALPLR